MSVDLKKLREAERRFGDPFALAAALDIAPGMLSDWCYLPVRIVAADLGVGETSARRRLRRLVKDGHLERRMAKNRIALIGTPARFYEYRATRKLLKVLLKSSRKETA